MSSVDDDVPAPPLGEQLTLVLSVARTAAEDWRQRVRVAHWLR